MPIIDYLRYTKLKPRKGGKKGLTHTIVIPPFHTGTLGFIPDSEVLVQVHSRHDDPESSGVCELYVTPFESRQDRIFRLACLLHDKPGVVMRLLNAVSSLKINIVKQESSIIDNSRFHHVTMLLDWTDAPRLEEPIATRTSDLHLYRYMAEKVPIHDYRYLLLYEKIMERCLDVMKVDPPRGLGCPRTPALRIEPFTGLHEGQGTRTRLKRHTEGHFNVALTLSKMQIEDICRRTRLVRDEPIPYILTTDGKRRNLRVFIPRKPHRIVHLGLIHKDRVGALAKLGSILEQAHFNIVTSLLRKVEKEKCTWEVLVEYQGNVDSDEETRKAFSQRTFESKEERWRRADLHARWFQGVVRREAEADRRREAIEDLEVKVVVPRYPKLSDRDSDTEYPLEGDEAGVDWEARRRERDDTQAVVRVATERPENDAGRVRHKLALDISERGTRSKPRIFISYPLEAREHFVCLRDELKEYFEVVSYDKPNFSGVMPSALDAIHNCDHFIGIWHHERRSDGQHGVSPWLPFEYGAACAAGKDVMVIHSEKLPKRITERIEPGIAHPSYSDLNYRTDMVPEVLRFCKDYWWARDQYPDGDVEVG